MSASSPPSRRSGLPLRARLATTVGGAAGRASRLAGRGDGSVIGGVIGLRLKPDLLSLLARGRQIVLVTGTNGKTTTTRLITAALGTLGQQVASNAFGANMEAGLVAALARAPDATMAVLEVDEKYMPAMLEATQRAGGDAAEPEPGPDGPRGGDLAAGPALAGRAGRGRLPGHRQRRRPLVAWAAGQARKVTWVAAGQRWHDDSWCCPNCGSHLRRDGDDWHCGECPNRRPPVSWVLAGDEVIDPTGGSRPLDLVLPGRANKSNAVVALAVADVFGVGVTPALAAARQVRSVAGRYTHVQRRGCDLRLLLAKNPAGWLEALDILVPAPVPVMLAVNAQVPDGRDTSWLWDVDYRRLRGRPVFVAGERRTDLAVRLEANEVAFRVVADVDNAVDPARSPAMEVIANYTAFQQIRALTGRTD